MDLELGGRVVLVVGGAGLIGSAVVDRLRQEGATAVVASRSAGSGDRAGIGMDARDADSVRAGVAQVLREQGRLDGVVVTAAPSARTLDPERRNDPAQVAEAVEGKALSFLRVANEVLPGMRATGFGRIVGVSGQNAWLTGNLTGAVRNAALIVAAKNLADESAGTGVLINVVNPGHVLEEPAAEVGTAQGGESSPAQIADLVAFLLSPRSAVSGESIAIGHRVKGVTTL